MSRSVTDLLAVLDEFEAPDQWDEIVANASERAHIQPTTSFDSPTEVVIEMSEPMNVHREKRNMSIKLIVGAAAAAVLIVVLALVVRTQDEKEPPAPADQTTPSGTLAPAPSVAPTTAATLSPKHPHLDAVSAMMDAFNSGHLDSFMTYFEPSAIVYGGTRMGEFRATAEAFMAAHEQWTLSGCATSGTNTVTCASSRRDDFHGAGGLVVTEDLEFEFNPDGRVVDFGSEPDAEFADYLAFDQRFVTWLAVAHPDVAAYYAPFLYDAGPMSRMPYAPDVPIALEYVDEFVAQSDDYPIAD
jgi:hypothetical protein